MLARLLRKTIGALNSTSDTEVETNNMRERCRRLGSVESGASLRSERGRGEDWTLPMPKAGVCGVGG